jgi:hypothetical protein
MQWHKSTKSGATSNCVELRSDRRAIRDSKAPHQTMMVTTASYTAFLAAIKHGALDRAQ